MRFDLRDRRGVVLCGAKLEQDAGILEIARQLFEADDLLLEPGALPGDSQDLALVFPKARGERLLLELVDLGLEPRKVKDAPLAP
jgi:hypothetical protein